MVCGSSPTCLDHEPGHVAETRWDSPATIPRKRGRRFCLCSTSKYCRRNGDGNGPFSLWDVEQDRSRAVRSPQSSDTHTHLTIFLWTLIINAAKQSYATPKSNPTPNLIYPFIYLFVFNKTWSFSKKRFPLWGPAKCPQSLRYYYSWGDIWSPQRYENTSPNTSTTNRHTRTHTHLFSCTMYYVSLLIIGH